MSRRGRDRELLARVGLLVLLSTLVVTAAFVGIVAALSGPVENFTTRLPFYVLAASVAFVVFVVLFDSRGLDGQTVIVASMAVGLSAFIVLSLGGEGVVFLLTNPEALIASQLIVYLIAAGLVCTGVAYWTLRHWRELAGTGP